MQNESKSCLECTTSGICCEVRGARCTCCQTVAPATIASRKFWETQENFRARAFEAVKAFEAALIEAAPVAEEMRAKARCPHYAVIKEFAALACENGLSMADKDRARGAMGVYLSIRINSRADLTAAQWQNAITGLRAGVLFW